MSLWDTISASAKNLGNKAANETLKAKLRADILLIDRSIDARKRAFGVAMYDYLNPLSKSQNFYVASDRLTEIVRPLLIDAQKEVQALQARRVKQKEDLAKAETNRAAAFPTKAETYAQKFVNFGKASVLHGGEAKIKTELSVTDRLIKGHKEDFGVALFDAFAKAEDEEGFLPTDRQIRNVYDTCRGDLDAFDKQKKSKEEEIQSTTENGKSTEDGSASVKHVTTATTTSTVISPANNSCYETRQMPRHQSQGFPPSNSFGYTDPSTITTTATTSAGFLNNSTPSFSDSITTQQDDQPSGDLLLRF